MPLFRLSSSLWPKLFFPLAVGVFCVGFAFTAFTAVEGRHWDTLRDSASAVTIDEFSHISMAFYYLSTGTYFLNPEHPPLVKDLAMIGALFIHPVIPATTTETPDENLLKSYPPKFWLFPHNHELSNDQTTWGKLFLLNPANAIDEIAFWTRLPLLNANTFFFVVLAWALALVWNRRAALLALMFLILSPLTLAHGALVTMDIPSSLLQVASLALMALFLQRFLEGRSLRFSFSALALIFTLALISKFSALLLFPILFLGGLVVVAAQSRSWQRLFSFILSFSALGLIAVTLVSGVYAFHIRHMSREDITSQLILSYPNDFSPHGLAFMRWLNNFTLTRPLAEYANGVTNVFSQLTDAPQKIYFLSTVHGPEGAGIGYFPLLYVTKLPEGLLLLNVVALLIAGVLIVRFFSQPAPRPLSERLTPTDPLSFLLIFFCLAYAAGALSSPFQIGVRHILPFIFGATLLTARALDLAWDWRVRFVPFIRLVALCGAMAALVFTTKTFPYYLSTYNTLGGGIWNGYHIATDSNYDWGQDVNKLSAWCAEHQVTTLYSDLFTSIPPEYYLGKINHGYNILSGTLPPSGSYLAVSVGRYMNNSFDSTLPPEKKYSRLEGTLVDRVGTSILVFKIP